jgi:uncharacterized membrane protein
MAPARSFVADALRLLAVAALLITLPSAKVAQAQAQTAETGGWSLCNQTSYVLEAAIGRPDGRAVLVQGWIRMRPGECKQAAVAPLARGVHYVYARTSDAHRGGRRQWGGDAKLCIDPSGGFATENPPACESMGLEERSFRRVQINKRETWRTNFAEANRFTLYGARAQGLQRLLGDAGYDVRTAAGGIDPRRVGASIAQFRTDAKLPANATEDQLFDGLENAARRRANAIGMTLCNRTSSKLWTAVARRLSEGWESRGWWPLGPGGCARAIDNPLIQKVYFVHAVMESTQGERFLAAPGEAFCSSPAKFAILGREGCGPRYYDETVFIPISTEGREGLVVDLSEGDFLPAGQAPVRSVARTVAPEDQPVVISPQRGARGTGAR